MLDDKITLNFLFNNDIYLCNDDKKEKLQSKENKDICAKYKEKTLKPIP